MSVIALLLSLLLGGVGAPFPMGSGTTVTASDTGGMPLGSVQASDTGGMPLGAAQTLDTGGMPLGH